jgi:hypothetical protein
MESLGDLGVFLLFHLLLFRLQYGAKHLVSDPCLPDGIMSLLASWTSLRKASILAPKFQHFCVNLDVSCWFTPFAVSFAMGCEATS